MKSSIWVEVYYPDNKYNNNNNNNKENIRNLAVIVVVFYVLYCFWENYLMNKYIHMYV